jgi:hypothetical protein
MEHIFTSIYENNGWGNNNNYKYKGSSGFGSEIDFNQDYIKFLKNWIKNNSIKSIVDLGCGDFKCGKLIYDNLPIKYTGYDAYKAIIDYHNENNSNDKYIFKHLDFFKYKESIESADVCILKDVLQHWKNQDIYEFLDYILQSKRFKWILICNCAFQEKDNQDIVNGDFRPLNYNMFPLKQYNPKLIFTYHTKEICLIYNEKNRICGRSGPKQVTQALQRYKLD